MAVSGLQPGLDRGVLRVKVGQIGHQIFDDRHVRQRIDLYVAFDVVDGPRARKRVAAIDVHRAGTANTLAAGTAKRQCRIDLIFDLDQRIENHRSAAIHIDVVGIHARIFARRRVVAIHGKLLHVLGVPAALKCLPLVIREFLGV